MREHKRDRFYFQQKDNHLNLSLLLMNCNGLAKLRGRFKRINLSNRAEASRVKLFIFWANQF